MINKIILAAILILSANQTFSQDSIKGRIIDYETNKTLPGVTIVDGNRERNDFRNGTISDRDGNFKIKVEDNKRYLELSFYGYYRIKFINIPKVDKTIDFKEIKLVRDHLKDNIGVGPFSEEQLEQDKKLRIDVLENYRIKIMGKNVKPYFDGNYNPIEANKLMVFDFDKQGKE